MKKEMTLKDLKFWLEANETHKRLLEYGLNNHCCGAQGFGQAPSDVCYVCQPEESEKLRKEISKLSEEIVDLKNKIRQHHEVKDRLYKKCLSLASKSECAKMKFGSVITDARGEIIGEGWNHFVDDCLGDFDCCEARKNIPSGTRLEYCKAVHAEQHAVADAVRGGCNDFSNVKLYVAGTNGDGVPFFQTKFYCSFCARILKVFGVRRVFVMSKDGWVENSIQDILRSSYEVVKITQT